MTRRIHWHRVAVAALSSLLSAVACGGSGDDQQGMSGTAGAEQSSADEEQGADEASPASAPAVASSAAPPAAEESQGTGYPAGPYGENNPQVGTVVENLSLRGVLNLDASVASEALGIGDYSLQDFRDTGRSHLLITTAAGWCSSCRDAAEDLGVTLEQRVVQVNASGGLVLNLLLDGARSGTLPTDNELVSWARAAELDVSVMGITDARGDMVFPEREWGYIVRLDTMQVVWNIEVSLYADPTVNELGLDQLERELGL